VAGRKRRSPPGLRTRRTVRRKAAPSTRPKKSTKKKSSRKQSATPAIQFSPTTRILGLDTSSTCVGYALYEGPVPVVWGRYVVEGKDHGEKLYNFALFIRQLITELKPDEVLYEQPFAGRRRNTFGILMQYVAHVRSVYWAQAGKEIPEINRVPAHMIKKVLRMPRGEDHEDNKRLAVDEVNAVYGHLGICLTYKKDDKKKTDSEDDTADAIQLVRAWIRINAPEWEEEAA
jgi:hypothetical protein